jgi:hypothetical protein
VNSASILASQHPVGCVNRYRVFGGVLASELPLPDLPEAVGPALPCDWHFRIVEGPSPAVILEQVGEHLAQGLGLYQLYRTSLGFRLVYAEEYFFDLREDGREIVWYPAPTNFEENTRALLLGYVMALASHLAGDPSLHGSAVAIDGQGVAIVGTKYHGKSTLGLSLSLAGGRFLTDDSVVIDLSSPLLVRPGVQSVRLWNDSAAALDAAKLDCVLVEGIKNTFTQLPSSMLQTTPVPLSTVYVLESVAGAQVAVERTPLSMVDATLMLVAHTKVPQPLLGSAAAAVQFRRAAELARRCPVYRLKIVRDFARLPEVVDTLLGWHQLPRQASVASLRPEEASGAPV